MTKIEKLLSAIKLDKELLSPEDFESLQTRLKCFLLEEYCVNDFELTALPDRICAETGDCNICWDAEAD